MRSAVPALALFAFSTSGSLLAQSVDFSTFVTLQDAQLTVAITPLAASNQWCNFSRFAPSGPVPLAGNFTCIGGTDAKFATPASTFDFLSDPQFPRRIGTDSAGITYSITGVVGLPGGAAILFRDTGAGPAQSIASLNLDTCPGHGCAMFYEFTSTVPEVDEVAGTITMTVEGRTCTNSNGCAFTPADARVIFSGLPKLFDVLLTFVPSGQTLAALTPGLPDGFRSADSLQAWTGNVGTLPDWSKAAPLVCTAATAPTPGQLISVTDTLPDPPLGQARYYVTATQSGTQRRLGRQYAGGAFSARNPATLPACQ